MTRERMYLDTMQQIFGATSKVIVDQKAGQNLLYLPLDRIMQLSSQPGASPGVSASMEPSVAPTPQPLPAPDSAARRDSLRSRDREAGR
jgi:membrane protease subunit HflK